MNQFVQILFAICLVILFLVVGLSVYNYEYLKSFKFTTTSKNIIREKVPIFEGIKDMSIVTKEVYTTTDNGSDVPQPSFRNVNSSHNQKGGIEFTYTFWLFMTQRTPSTTPPTTVTPDAGFTADNVDSQTILFVKGSDALSTFKNVCGSDKLDYMVKCPLVKLEERGSQLTVEFNTLASKTDGSEYIEAIKQGSRDVCKTPTTQWKTANAHKITLGNINRPEFSGKWILVSIVMTDTSAQDHLPYRNKARCSIYINNYLELDTYVDGSLVPSNDNVSTINVNKGNLYVFPIASLQQNINTYSHPPAKNIMMGDLTFYNYAIDSATISSLFTSGPPLYTATSIGANQLYNDVATKSDYSTVKQTTSP